jgi:predicted TIM-barrel fold metal-dependent hydrolase
MRMFGLPERYPAAPGRTYTPSLKPLAEYQPVADWRGLQRVVLARPGAYGIDNRAQLDTLWDGVPSVRAVVAIDGACDASPPAGYRPVDELALLNVLRPSVGNAAAWHTILVDNPVQLYGF